MWLGWREGFQRFVARQWWCRAEKPPSIVGQWVVASWAAAEVLVG